MGDVYSVTLERLRALTTSRARLGMDALVWVAYSKRPLQEDELCQSVLGQDEDGRQFVVPSRLFVNIPDK